MPGFHSSRSPSGAHRYRRCAGSVRAEEGLPDGAGLDAAHGTVFHEIAADVLETGADPLAMVGAMVTTDHGPLPFTVEMATKMMPGLTLIQSLADDHGAKMFVETRVRLDPWLGEGESGTSDVTIINPFRNRIVQFDWKWGAGVPVSPVENDQCTLYTLGVWNEFGHLFDADPEEIEVVVIIEQPRAAGGGGTWTTTMARILAEGEKIKRDAAATHDPDAPRTPGSIQCKFCKAAKFGTCPEYAEFNAALLGLKFDSLEDDLAVCAPLDLADRRTITPEQRSQILLHRAMIDRWLDQMHEDAYADAEAGRPVPGMKLVDGRTPPRAWMDEGKAELLLKSKFGEAAFIKKLRSPANVEEEVGKKSFKLTFQGFVEVGEAKPILVPEHDKRPARKTHGDKYDDLVDDEEETPLI